MNKNIILVILAGFLIGSLITVAANALPKNCVETRNGKVICGGYGYFG